MSEVRTNIVKQAFQLLDEAGKGYLPVEFLMKKYNAAAHPRVRTREKTAEDILKDFEVSIKAKAYY